MAHFCETELQPENNYSSTRRRDSNALVADKERYFKLSEHLKIEKNHLVEVILTSSTD